MSTYSYKEATDFLFTQFPQFHKVGSGAYKPGLQGMQKLCAYLKQPQLAYPCIHVAGTNGKGSVCHLLAAAFQQAGLRTGLYTSPHLVDFRERIKVNGQPISEQGVTDFVYEIRQGPMAEAGLSFFEITTGLAFRWFAEQKVDVAVIETGLGGRLDATNILTPILSVITSIGLDHCDLLGHTLEAVAKEKAGILKPGVHAVLGESLPQTFPVLDSAADACGAPLFFADLLDNMFSNLLVRQPEYFPLLNRIQELVPRMDLGAQVQRKNAVTVLTALDLVMHYKLLPCLPPHPENAFLDGMARAAALTGLHARWERLHPRSPFSPELRVIVDSGHNAHALAHLPAQLKAETYARLFVVMGVVKEKDLDSILQYLPRQARYFFTQAQIARALPAPELAARLQAAGFAGEVVPTVPEALHLALSHATPDDLILVAGSNFTAGEALGSGLLEVPGL